MLFRAIRSRAVGPHLTVLPRALSASSRLFKEDLNVLYDSKCSLCLFEISMIAKLDSNMRIKFTDIEDDKYEPSNPENGNISYEQAMTSMHAVKSNGDIIVGVPVFQEMYSTVGLGFLFAFTKYAFLRKLASHAYDLFAAYRTQVTRGRSVSQLVAERNEKISEKLRVQSMAGNCEGDRCGIMKNMS